MVTEVSWTNSLEEVTEPYSRFKYTGLINLVLLRTKAPINYSIFGEICLIGSL